MINPMSILIRLLKAGLVGARGSDIELVAECVCLFVCLKRFVLLKTTDRPVVKRIAVCANRQTITVSQSIFIH